MKALENKDMTEQEQEIILWLERRGIPSQNYKNISTFNKNVLRNLVCTPTRTTTYAQREELYRKLCLSGSRAGKYSPHSSELMTDEGRQRLFSPLTPGESLPDLYKDYLELQEQVMGE